MTKAKYQRRREIIDAEIVDGSRDQASRLGYTRAWNSAQDKRDRNPPRKMMLKSVEGEVEIKLGSYIVFRGERGYVPYTPTEFNRRWEPYVPRTDVEVNDDFDVDIVDKDLDFCITIGDPYAENPDFALVGGPNALANVGRIVHAIQKPDPENKPPKKPL